MRLSLSEAGQGAGERSGAHNKHYYQRLVRMGWATAQRRSPNMLLMLACGTTALWRYASTL